MKVTLSLTLDKTLVALVDREPGATRSEKIDSVLRRYRAVQRDLLLQEELRAFGAADGDDDREHDACVRVMQEAMWRKARRLRSPARPGGSGARR